MDPQTNTRGAIPTALERIDRAERQFKAAFLLAAAIEVAFLGGYLLLADFSNRLHMLLFIATVAVYSIVVIGLVALGAHVNRSTLRILKAFEFAEQQRTQ